MDILRFEDCERYRKNEACELYEYSSIGSEFDLAVVKISGRYPDRGYCVNSMCKEVIYIIEGKGSIYEGAVEHRFKKGDAIVIASGERFRWEADCVATISCSPPWSSEQYKIVSE